MDTNAKKAQAFQTEFISFINCLIAAEILFVLITGVGILSACDNNVEAASKIPHIVPSVTGTLLICALICHGILVYLKNVHGIMYFSELQEIEEAEAA
jgi:hypothetical protein